MSTRVTEYFWSPANDQGGIHIYREMHDEAVHCHIHDGTNAEVNFIVSPGILSVLLGALRHECL